MWFFSAAHVALTFETTLKAEAALMSSIPLEFDQTLSVITRLTSEVDYGVAALVALICGCMTQDKLPRRGRYPFTVLTIYGLT